MGRDSGDRGRNGYARSGETGRRVCPPLLPGNLAQGRAPGFLQTRGRFLFTNIGTAGEAAGAAASSDRAGKVMSKGVSAVEYIMEDPREAMRLEAKVDAHAWVQKYLAQRVGAGAEVLSVGCGPGVILREVVALHKSIQATGVDISEDRIREAKQRHRGGESMNFVRGDAHAMEFPSNSFDLVYSRMLLEYLKDKEQA